MTDGIIFDVDGTLWDSTPIVKDAWNKALRDFGIEDVTITADQLKGLFGLPMDDIIERILPDYPLEKRVAFRPYCFDYEHRFLQETPGILYPELEETLRALALKYPLFIVSNCQAGYIELFLEKTGFSPYFKDHVCPGDTNLLKADNILYIAQKHGLKKPVYVGDTKMDHEACIKAQVPFVFASYGFGDTKDPDYEVSSPKKLLEIF